MAIEDRIEVTPESPFVYAQKGDGPIVAYGGGGAEIPSGYTVLDTDEAKTELEAQEVAKNKAILESSEAVQENLAEQIEAVVVAGESGDVGALASAVLALHGVKEIER